MRLHAQLSLNVFVRIVLRANQTATRFHRSMTAGSSFHQLKRADVHLCGKLCESFVSESRTGPHVKLPVELDSALSFDLSESRIAVFVDARPCAQALSRDAIPRANKPEQPWIKKMFEDQSAAPFQHCAPESPQSQMEPTGYFCSMRHDNAASSTVFVLITKGNRSVSFTHRGSVMKRAMCLCVSGLCRLIEIKPKLRQSTGDERLGSYANSSIARKARSRARIGESVPSRSFRPPSTTMM